RLAHYINRRYFSFLQFQFQSTLLLFRCLRLRTILLYDQGMIGNILFDYRYRLNQTYHIYYMFQLSARIEQVFALGNEIEASLLRPFLLLTATFQPFLLPHQTGTEFFRYRSVTFSIDFGLKHIEI